MVDTYEILQKSLSDLHSSSSQFRPIIEKFYKDRDTDFNTLFMTLSGEDPYQLLFMKIYQLVLFYSQSGSDLNTSNSLAQWIGWAKSNYLHQMTKEIISEIDIFYISGLRIVVDYMTDMSNSEILFEIIGTMIASGGNFKSYSDLIIIKVVPWIWESIIPRLLDGTCEKSLIITAVKVIEKGQTLQINNDDLNYVVIDRIFDYIKKKFDYYQLEGERLDTTEAQELLECLTRVKINDQELVTEFQKLKEFYGTRQPQGVPDAVKYFKLSLSLDTSKLVADSQIYFYNKDPNFQVRVDKYKLNGRDIAIKGYIPKGKPLNMDPIYNEIKFYELLSSKRNENNCFLEYIGTLYHDGSVYLGMEYHPLTLSDKIDKISKKQDNPFTVEQLRNLIHSMISSFSLMEDLQIFHRDIKPSNFLYTSTGKVKIIDFGGAEFKDPNQSSVFLTRNASVAGTPAFMSPEVYEAHINKQDKVKTMRGTSDVFSLGMTILQMIVLRSLETLNMRGNNARLMNIINTEVREEWIKSLLFAMLQEDYKRRPRFNDCLSFIQSGDTKSLGPT